MSRLRRRILTRTAFLFACAAASISACALPVVSAGSFLPAGDLHKGQVHASGSVEIGRVLAGPVDVDASARAIPPGAKPWTVSTWIASDASVRWAVAERVQLEGQIKLTNPVSPFVPELVGGAVGARVRLRGREREDRGFALELGGRWVAVGVQQSLVRNQDQRTQTDNWNYRGLGLEVPLVSTWRLSRLVAVTGSPFLRLYWIKAWHSIIAPDGAITTTRLDWTPVLSAGLGLSVAMELGPLQIAPGLAAELAARPGGDQTRSLLFEPGLSVGTRW